MDEEEIGIGLLHLLLSTDAVKRVAITLALIKVGGGYECSHHRNTTPPNEKSLRLRIPPFRSLSYDDKPTGKMVALASATVKLFSSPVSV